MLIMAVTGLWPAAAAWSTNEEERRKALMSYFLYGVPYILWDNIARGMQISCPHIEKSCTAAYYSDRKLGVSQMVCTAASTIHFFTGNNIGPRGDLASRSLQIRLDVDRADPENRTFKHPDPIGWTEDHRAEILAALYTILLGNPQLKRRATRRARPDSRCGGGWSARRSRMPPSWPGTSSTSRNCSSRKRRTTRRSASLADVLDVLVKKWPDQFTASDVAGMINNPSPNEDEQTLREYLLPGALPHHVFSAKSIGQLLKQHLDEPVRSGERTLVLRSWEDKHSKLRFYGVRTSRRRRLVCGVCGVCGVCFSPSLMVRSKFRGDSNSSDRAREGCLHIPQTPQTPQA